MSILSINDLNVQFPTPEGLVKAVNSVDLELDEGERLGLIGETGSGKTVLGQAIVRLLSGAEVKGNIEYRRRKLLSLDEADMRKIRGREISVIFQSPNSLNPVLKVGDQIAESIRLVGGSNGEAAKKKAVSAIEAVGIPDAELWADRYPHQFSGGMKERAMIALGLACDPRLIIADEPTKGLDANVKAQVVELIRNVTTGKSLLFITHDLSAAALICDRIAVMYCGEIVEWGPTGEIFSNPLHPYTEGLLRSLPIMGMKPIKGASPSLIYIPSGCRFHPRCERGCEKCAVEHPPLAEAKLRSGHRVRCFQNDRG
jgi:peptide/nickel transport system ATP-binding protein